MSIESWGQIEGAGHNRKEILGSNKSKNERGTGGKEQANRRETCYFL